MREPTLSLCMIVRNEEAFLDACLESAAPVADEIVVVDTGSTDRTPEIARRHGAKVVFHPWGDDFSEVRNISLGHATGDWVLVLDADERLDPAGHDEIRRALRDPKKVAYQLPVVNLYGDRDPVVSLITRLFRRAPQIRFENVIHEQVTRSLARHAAQHGLDFGILRSQIVHEGYHPSVVELRGKNERNRALFEKQLERHPEDLYSWYKYADFLRRFPDPAPANAAFARAYDLMYRSEGPRDDHLFAGEIVAFHALAHLVAGDALQADAICRRGLDDVASATPNLLHVAGKIAADRGRPEEAEALLRRCLEMEGKAHAMPGQPGITSYLSRAELGRLLVSQGREDEGMPLLEQAVDQAGGAHRRPLLLLVKTLYESRRPADGLRALTRHIRSHGEHPELAITAGKILLDIGNAPAAEKWLRRIDTGPQLPEARALLARSLLVQGELRLAEDVYAALPEGPGRALGIRVIRILRGETPDRPLDAGDEEERAAIGSILRGWAALGNRALVESLASHLGERGRGIAADLPAMDAEPGADGSPAEVESETSTRGAEVSREWVGEPDDTAGDRRLRAQLRPYASLFPASGKVLDVRCGTGTFLEELASCGHEAVGIDPDAASVEEARARGLQAEVLAPDEIDTLPRDFDGVHAAHVLETLDGRRARTFLRACAERLAPGGRLVIRTRNWDHPQVQAGGFWLDSEHVRPYPLPLVADLVCDLGLDVERRGFEASGWNDAYLVARKGRAADSDSSARAAHTAVLEGELFSARSFARVNRSLASALVKQGVEVSLLPRDDDLPAPDPHGLSSRLFAPLRREAAFHVRHFWPAVFVPPVTGRWIQIQPYEFGRIPKDWVAPILEGVDEIWVPSHYARRCYTESGIPEDRVAVIPNGVDAARFRPDVDPLPLATRKRFRFLFVGGSIWRKGVDVLLDAFTATFTRNDDVCLVIKEIAADPLYRDRNAEARIRSLTETLDAPEIVYLDHEIDEEDVPRLYAACDVLVHPYRGEGFGMPVLEALACARPVIVTRGGACDEFVPAGASIPVEARRLDIEPAGLVLAGTGWVLEPDRESLASALRAAVSPDMDLRAMGSRGREHAATRHTWARAAELARRRLDALAARPPRRRARPGQTLPPGPLETAVAKLLTGDSAAALEVLAREALHRPGDPVVSHWIGRAYEMQGDQQRARAAFEEAVGADPNDAASWYRLGLAQARSDDEETARRSMERAVALGHDEPDVWNDLGVLYAGSAQSERAESCLMRAMRLCDRHVDAVYNLGMLWIGRQEPERARELARATLAADADHPGAVALERELGARVPASS